jgi:hypothetical protein
MYSTINIYVGYITPIMRSSITSESNVQSRLIRDIEVACDKAHADEEGTSALPFTADEIKQFIDEVVAELDEVMQAFLWTMITTGWRFIDIIRMRRRQLTIREVGKNSTPHLLATIKWSKTIVTRAMRRTALFPIVHHPSQKTHRFLATGDPSEKLFREIKYSKVLQTLKAFKKASSTYSIRYAFIAWALEKCKGNVDEVARRFTLHRDATMLNAFYIQWSNSTHLMSHSEDMRTE